MTNSKYNQAITTIISATIICIALIGITIYSPEMQQLKMYPTQMSNITSQQMAEMDEMNQICADGYCSIMESESNEIPSSFDIMTNSIQNAIDEAIEWFDNTIEDIERKMDPMNFQEFVAQGK